MTTVPLTTAQRSSIADFPLGQFGLDLSKPIGQRDIDDCEAQIAFAAHKQGADPGGPDVLRACDALRVAASRHNALRVIGEQEFTSPRKA